MMNLNNVIARAQRMMLDENFQRDVERAARAHRGSSARNNGGGNDLADLDAAIFGVSSPSNDNIYQKVPLQEGNYGQPMQANYNGIQLVQEVKEQKAPRNSKVPAIIQESFEKVPYQGNAFDISGGALRGLVLEQAPVQQQNPQPQQNYYSANGITAEMLQHAVNEAVKEALKGRLDEGIGNSMKGFRIAAGNVIQFIDSKGNLYEGQLKLKKRANN